LVTSGLAYDRPKAWVEFAGTRTTVGAEKPADNIDHVAYAAHGACVQEEIVCTGLLEVDETYVGGAEQGVRGGETSAKFIVRIAIEILSPKGFGRIRLHRLHDVSATA
jgi:hypothetical protein